LFSQFIILTMDTDKSKNAESGVVTRSRKIVAVIPSRYQSSRLPGKPLLKLGEKTMIQLVYEQVAKAKHLDELVVATDDSRIYEHVLSFGGAVMMTSAEHQSGTDRIAELVEKNPHWDLIINVQGDEPFLDPADIDSTIHPFLLEPNLEMLSIYHEISDESEIFDPNNVKVVTDINDYALYFSRSPIPYVRDKSEINLKAKKHLGLYVYKRDVLLTLARLPQSELEELEKLEQLRALENQIKIKMIRVKSAAMGIDTEADYLKALELLSTIRTRDHSVQGVSKSNHK
jgi:3-deoxy-manno-octulosonate cytidylyltransferase (CMP-KDO synthetase)